MAAVIELPISTYESVVEPDWCPGCGDFGVLRALEIAAGKLGIYPKDLMVVSGIGCSSNLPGFIHGYGIGIGHFIHAMRRNLDLTYIVMNNQIYGLTTGQASPTTMKEVRTKSTPMGNFETPINPVALALVSGATYVSRGFSGENKHLAELIAGAISHKGFALVDVFSPCVTYNKINTYEYFRKRVYKLEADADFDAANVEMALARSFEWNERIPIGVFYRDEQPTYEDREPALQNGPLVHQQLGLNKEMFDELMEEFM
jgi:2-oxoglutarate/2-oxoacid ferredoxin oxidoreductase subunit beta